MAQMDTTSLQIYNNYRSIDRYQKKLNIYKSLALLSLFVCFCNMIGCVVINRHTDISNFIFWFLTLTALIVFGILAYKCAKKTKDCKIQNYNLEKDALERKMRVAKIRNEILPDSMYNKVLKEPSPDIVFPFNYFIILVFLHIFFGILMISVNL